MDDIKIVATDHKGQKKYSVVINGVLASSFYSEGNAKTFIEFYKAKKAYDTRHKIIEESQKTSHSFTEETPTWVIADWGEEQGIPGVEYIRDEA